MSDSMVKKAETKNGYNLKNFFLFYALLIGIDYSP